MKKINIKGVIVTDADKELYEWYEMENTAPMDVAKALEDANGEDIEVVINSGGGYINAGTEIYSALENYQGEVNIRILWAGSAASVIAMARHSVMEPTALIMIHNVSGVAQGDYRDMQHESEVLRTASIAMSTAYQRKTGLTEKEVLKLMDEETWLDSKKALELGFVDEIAQAQKPLVAAALGVLTEKELKQARQGIAKAKAQARLEGLRR